MPAQQKASTWGVDEGNFIGFPGSEGDIEVFVGRASENFTLNAGLRTGVNRKLRLRPERHRHMRRLLPTVQAKREQHRKMAPSLELLRHQLLLYLFAF